MNSATPGFRIRLAAPSLLFAPFYLAKQASRHSAQYECFRRVDFDYASYATKPRRGRRYESKHPIDSLVYPLAAQEVDINQNEQYLFAVGDPTKIATAIDSGSQYRQPLLHGGLINQIHLWLVNTVPPGATPQKTYYKLLVHEKRWTTYTIAYYHLLRCKAPKDVIERILSPVTAGDEDLWYRSRLRMDTARTDDHLGLLATDPILAAKAGQRVTHRYAIDTQIGQAMMTGVLLTEEIHDQEGRLISDLLGSIRDAIELLCNDPELAAFYVVQHRDPHYLIRSRYSWKELRKCFDKFQIQGVFARDLSAPTAPFEHATRIHLEVAKAQGENLFADHLSRVAEDPTKYMFQPLHETSPTVNGEATASPPAADWKKLYQISRSGFLTLWNSQNGKSGSVISRLTVLLVILVILGGLLFSVGFFGVPKYFPWLQTVPAVILGSALVLFAVDGFDFIEYFMSDGGASRHSFVYRSLKIVEASVAAGALFGVVGASGSILFGVIVCIVLSIAWRLRARKLGTHADLWDYLRARGRRLRVRLRINRQLKKEAREEH